VATLPFTGAQERIPGDQLRLTKACCARGAESQRRLDLLTCMSAVTSATKPQTKAAIRRSRDRMPDV
jgi:hypothetical protein